MNTNLVTIGRFGSCYGVRGWIKVQSFTIPADNIIDFKNQWIIKQKGPAAPIKIDGCKRHGQLLIAKIDGIADRDEVRQFTNAYIMIEREHLPKLEQQEYYLHDLKGLEVYTTNNELLGKVVDFYDAGGNDVFIVKGDKEHWLPYTDAVIKQIDPEQGKIIADWDSEF